MSQHFTGETVVTRGPWQMQIPLDFHFIVNPEEDYRHLDQAVMVIAKFLSEEYVLEKEAEAANFIEDEEED